MNAVFVGVFMFDCAYFSVTGWLQFDISDAVYLMVCITSLSHPSFLCPIRAPNAKTKRCRETEMSVNVSQARVTCVPVFSLKGQ